MRILIVLLIMISALEPVSSQNRDEVLAYIENNSYALSPRAEYVVDVKNFEIENAFLKDIQTGLLHGVKNTHRTKEPNLTYIDEYDEPSSFSLMTSKGPHYIFTCEVLDYEFIDNKSGQGGKYYIAGAIKGLDVVTGSILFYKTFEVKGKSKSSKRILKYDSSDISKAVAKKVRETTRDALKAHFPIVNWVMEIEETKKDKAKSISANKLRHMKQSNPKKVYAYAVDKELEVNGSKVFTFKKIGEAKKPKTDNKQMKKIFYKVNKGEKEILAYYNEGKPIFLTPIILGK